MPVGQPASHWYFADHEHVEVPEQYVLELKDGRLLGRHAAVVTASGRLDEETSHYFNVRGWREHPVNWNPYPASPQAVDGTVAVLATRGTGHNYYHFMVDALPRIGMLSSVLEGREVDAWVVDRSTRYHRELLAMVGLADARLVEPGPGFSLRATRLLVPSLPNASTFVTAETTAWLRETLPPQQSGLAERIYVTRGSTPHTRRMMHEDAVFERLRLRGFERIDPGTLSVQEQIDHFASARVVVAPHGAALTNLNFCRPGVRVLECFAPGYVNGGYWSVVSNIDESRYRYLVGDEGRVARPGRPQRGLMQDISVTPAQIDAALDTLLAV